MLKIFTVKNGLVEKRMHLRRAWTDPLVKMDLQEVGLGLGWGLDWIDLAQDRDRWRADMNVVMNPRVL